MIANKLLQSKRLAILEAANKRGARDVRVFGSYARGDEKPDSDVDFLVNMEPGRSLMDLGGLLSDLEELLGRRVDIATEKGLHAYLKDSILKEAREL
ncbi:MAG: nucleotidyltransferase family protein [Candidatus Sumerlaeia bacterium]